MNNKPTRPNAQGNLDRYETITTQIGGKTIARQVYNHRKRYGKKYQEDRLEVVKPVQVTQGLFLCPFCWRLTCITMEIAAKVGADRYYHCQHLHYRLDSDGLFLWDYLPACNHCHVGVGGNGMLKSSDPSVRESSKLHNSKVWYQCQYAPDYSHQREPYLTIFRWQTRLAVQIARLIRWSLPVTGKLYLIWWQLRRM